MIVYLVRGDAVVMCPSAWHKPIASKRLNMLMQAAPRDNPESVVFWRQRSWWNQNGTPLVHEHERSSGAWTLSGGSQFHVLWPHTTNLRWQVQGARRHGYHRDVGLGLGLLTSTWHYGVLHTEVPLKTNCPYRMGMGNRSGYYFVSKRERNTKLLHRIYKW